MCKSSILVEAIAVAPITNKGTIAYLYLPQFLVSKIESKIIFLKKAFGQFSVKN